MNDIQFLIQPCLIGCLVAPAWPILPQLIPSSSSTAGSVIETWCFNLSIDFIVNTSYQFSKLAKLLESFSESFSKEAGANKIHGSQMADRKLILSRIAPVICKVSKFPAQNNVRNKGSA